MKNISGPAAIIIVLFLSSCEKVIDVNLNDAEKKYVVEGFLSNQTAGAEVRVSQTKDFDDTNDFNGISGAVISLTNSIGDSFTFTEQSPGIYKTVSFSGSPGVAYTLTVSIDSNFFAASSTMPPLVLLDSIFTSEINFGGEVQKNITVRYNDPVGFGNSYRFVAFVNGVKEDHVYVHSDDLDDGNTVTLDLVNFDDDDNELKTGDLVQVDMQCIDEAVYKYWYSLSQLEEGAGQSATPTNPVSNFSGGCLGYFSAHPVTTKTIIVQ